MTNDRFCADCKRWIFTFTRRLSHLADFRPGCSKIQCGETRPHIYLCDACRRADERRAQTIAQPGILP